MSSITFTFYYTKAKNQRANFLLLNTALTAPAEMLNLISSHDQKHIPPEAFEFGSLGLT